MKSDVTLTSTGKGPACALTLGGTDISQHVMGLHLWIEPGTLDRHIELHLRPGQMGVELDDTHVLVDAETHDLLVRLGWTPPGGEIPCR